MPELIFNFFNLEIIKTTYPMLLRGLGLTLILTVVLIPLSAFLGLVLASVGTLGNRLLNAVLIIFIDVIRALPPLVLLIFIYYGFPFLGVRLSNFAAVALALALNGSCYFSEIFRAGLESVPQGQMEAARSTGLSRIQALVYVIIPQGTRNVMPDLATNVLELTKMTSIASVVGLAELLRSAQLAQGLTYNPTPLVMAALIYLAFLWPLVRIISRMQQPFVRIR